MAYEPPDFDNLAPETSDPGPTDQDLEEKEFVQDVLNKVFDCKTDTDEWRQNARHWFDYFAGDQWDEQDIMELEENGKPIVTFNRTEIFVNAVIGLEALNRHEVNYVPRKAGAIRKHAMSDLWTAAAHYVNDDSDAEVAHSHAFCDMAICGMGWSETKTDYDKNPDGDIAIEHRDPLHSYWDTRAAQRNIRDSRWRATVFPMDLDEVREEWPDKADDIVYSKLLEPDFENRPYDASNAWRYESDNTKRGVKEGEEIWVLQFQWYETEKFYRIHMSNGVKDIPAKQWRKIIERVPAYKAFRTTGPFPKRQYKRCFICGWTLLEEQDIQADDFTLQCMTGKRNRNDNTWYGLVKNLKDPQDWVNKLFSEILYIISTNAKGGLLAEAGAFQNPQKAEREWAQADSIVWANEGAIAGSKIIPKPVNNYPVGLDRLLAFSMEMFQDVTGASLELLGLTEKVQPGVVEAQRKQAGMTILSWAFDALRHYRKTHGRVLASYIRAFIADNRLIRVANTEGMEEFVPLVRDKLALEYDIIVAESPTSTNERERVFQVLTQILPAMIKLGVKVPPELVEYLPLPANLIESWKQHVAENQQREQAQAREQIATAQGQADVQKTRAEIQQRQADAKLKMAQAVEKQLSALTGGK